MTTTKALQFMRRTAEDEQLQQHLGEVLGVGDGDISSHFELDEAEADALTGDRAPLVVKLASQQGFDFSVEDLRTVVDAFGRYQLGELSEAEFSQRIGLSNLDQGTKESIPSIKKTLEYVYRGTRYQRINGKLVPVIQPTNSTPSVLQFMQKTSEDQDLQQQLATLLGVGDGDISSQMELDVQEAEALRGDRAPLVVKFAAQQGFNFSVEDLRTTVDAFQQYQSGEISANDFSKIICVSNLDPGTKESISSITKTLDYVYRGTRYKRINGKLVPVHESVNSTPNVLQFMQKTAFDPEVKQKLGSLLGVGDGDISNHSELDQQEAAALIGDRAPLVVKFAAQYGFDFSVEQLTTVVDAFVRYKSNELSDQDLAKILGLSDQGTPASLPSIKQTLEFVYRGTRYQKINGQLVPVEKPATTVPKVLQFMQKTAEDKQLQQQLGTLLGVGDGDISSYSELDAAEAQALTNNAPVVVEFAAKQGFEFSQEDLIRVVDGFAQYQSGELSEKEFSKIIGFSSQGTKESFPTLKKLVSFLSGGAGSHH